MKSEIVGKQMTDLAAKDVKPMSGPETKTFRSKLISKIIFILRYIDS